MKYTSAEAAKLLRSLNEEHDTLLLRENQSKSFVAALSEDPDSVRPEYDYEDVQKKLAETERRIRIVKHAINLFNVTHTVPGFDMTIDEVLVYIPQLSNRKNRLAQLAGILPKTRERVAPQSSVIDYRYANYDVDKAGVDAKEASDLLAKVQTALDVVNTTEQMDIEL